ncbi:polysaccharide lyase family 8 super-sandwich domain-containing protein [Tessaracoccus rhinocerotis]|uniref:polysaccharide lyase family 8 super-sandwich domain-containing protein n=1 Tax=Tessaracoccus rhinocerotis TaxID=1689449 RepID=UPI00163D97FE|nr:polysaccharide lyase family 8 super-sandwich domain-containing protein [Tessaracoccus rhinocerotis]
MAADPGDLPLLLQNFRSVHAGTATSNQSAAAAPRIALIEADGERYLSRLRPPSQWEQYSGVINDVRLGLENSSNGAVASGRLTSTFRVLCTLALATAAPGAQWFGDTAKQDQLIAALRWVVENYYSAQGNPYTGTGDTYGDWWDWEIGSPNEITRTLAHLYDRILLVDPGLVDLCVTMMDSHLLYVPRFHSGANRADISLNYLVQGALTADAPRVSEGLAAFLTVTQVVDPVAPVDGITDGFYPDGSFLQHVDVPYTGAYGKNLLTRLTQLVAVTAGTSLIGVSGLPSAAHGWVQNSFAPVTYEGHLLELVKGRIAARTNVGYEDAHILVEAFTQLAASLPTAQGEALRAYIKHIAQTSDETIEVATFVSPLAIAAFDALMTDAALVPEDPFFESGHKPFNSMERSVHGRPGYRFAIARSSSRIAKYETLSGANPRPWFQGEGAYYLYLSGQDQTQAYGGEYLHVVHPTKLAGVTAQVGEERAQSGNSPWATNDHSAGADVDGYGTASQQLGHEFNLTYLNPEGVKSWYMFDEEIVVLGADLSEPAGRDLITSVDTRISPAGSSPVFNWVDGDGFPGTGGTTGSVLQYARWSEPVAGGAVGYVFLNASPVSIESGAVSVTGPDLTRVVSNVSFLHAGDQPTSLAYAIVPNADEPDLEGYQDGRLVILANDASVQGVTHTGLGVTMLNFFSSSNAGVFESDGPASAVFARRSDGTIGVGISEPTFVGSSLTLRLSEPGIQLVSAEPGVTVSISGNVTEITLDTDGAAGRVFRLELLDLAHSLTSVEAGLSSAIELGSISASAVPRLRAALQVARTSWEAGRGRPMYLALLRFSRFVDEPRSATAGGEVHLRPLRELATRVVAAVKQTGQIR